MTQPEMDNRNQSIPLLVGKCVAVAVLMFGFGYLLIPLYDKFCEITGLGGRTGEQVAESALTLGVDESRNVTVHFDANVNSGLAWRFEPQEVMKEVHPGRLYETTYLATNESDRTVVAQAVPSVAPGKASLYFNKTECFCFTEQVLGPGESREMPVRFIIDPKLPRGVDLVTLSYIIYRNDQATELASMN